MTSSFNARRFALAPYTGAGTTRDPYRPRVAQHYASIDRRPDSTRCDGWALVAIEEPAPGLIDLGDGGPSPTIARVLSRAFGHLPLAGRRFGDAIASLMFHPTIARVCGNVVSARGRYEIHLGNLVWSAPCLRGGATLTDSFTQANGTLATTADQTWTNLDDAMGVFGNRLHPINTNIATTARCEADLATVDHAAQIALDEFAGYIVGGTGVRFINGPYTGYWGLYRHDPAVQMHKVISSVQTELLNTACASQSVPAIFRTTIVGSTLTVYGGVAGATQLGQITDTAIDGVTVGGKRVAVYGYGSSTLFFDSFFAEDIAVGGSVLLRRILIEGLVVGG